MTGRERINSIMNKRPVDRLSWTTIVDGTTLNNLPYDMKGMSVVDFCRYIGCDIFSLNCWGMPYGFSSPSFILPDYVKVNYREDKGNAIHELQTPDYTLTRIHRNSHPIKYPVTSLKEVKIYREIWENAQFLDQDDSQVYAKANEMIGEDGIITRFWGPSTIPKLLEEDMGVENFYYLLNDHPKDMEALINTIHQRELKAFEILAQGPCDVIILCENTSTFYISPDIYRKYNGPHVRDFVEICHSKGKIAIIHMCGHVANILHQIKDTGLDGIHALTPPPTGDTPWELALDVLGEEAIIIGVLDPTIFIMGKLDEISLALDELYTPRLLRSNFILCPAADGISVPLERFQVVANWMNCNIEEKMKCQK
jgi:hypothetical protein